MKLQAEKSDAEYVITAQGDAFVDVNRVRHASGIAVGSGRAPAPWGVDGFAALGTADFAALLDPRPELVLIGTGSVQRFPSPALLRPLIEAGIGFEVMNTPAACRTYNILVGEGRRVVAALLVGSDTATTPLQQGGAG